MKIELSDEDHKLVSEILIEAFLNAILNGALKKEEERMADAEAQEEIQRAMTSDKAIPRYEKFLIHYDYKENVEALVLYAKDRTDALARLAAICENGGIAVDDPEADDDPSETRTERVAR